MAALRECRMAAWHMEIGSTIIHACVLKASRYRKGWTAREPLGRSMRAACGEVLEWLNRHAWKACRRLNRLEGSNPSLSVRMGGDDGQGPRDENPLTPSGPEGSSGVWDLSGAAVRPDSSLPDFSRSGIARDTRTGIAQCEQAPSHRYE